MIYFLPEPETMVAAAVLRLVIFAAFFLGLCGGSSLLAGRHTADDLLERIEELQNSVDCSTARLLVVTTVLCACNRNARHFFPNSVASGVPLEMRSSTLRRQRMRRKITEGVPLLIPVLAAATLRGWAARS